MAGGYNLSLYLSSSNWGVCGVENLEELLLYYIELSYVLSYIKWSFEKIRSHSLTLKTTTGNVYVSRVLIYTVTDKNK